MFEELKGIFMESSALFLKQERNLILSTVSERCLCGALMLILNKKLRNTAYYNYHTDIEYNRNGTLVKTILNEKYEVIDITCDLIVHSRGEIQDNDNLIAIEMKKRNGNNSNADRKRLKALTSPIANADITSVRGEDLPPHVCGYKLGVFYQINEITCTIDVEYYSDGILRDSIHGEF